MPVHYMVYNVYLGKIAIIINVIPEALKLNHKNYLLLSLLFSLILEFLKEAK